MRRKPRVMRASFINPFTGKAWQPGEHQAALRQQDQEDARRAKEKAARKEEKRWKLEGLTTPKTYRGQRRWEGD